MMTFWDKARELIASGKTGQSLALLREQSFQSPELEAELILYSARLSQIERTERVFSQDNSTELIRLQKSILDFIELQEGGGTLFFSPPSDFFPKLRRNSLQKKIKETYLLIEQWEQKMVLSENPTDQKRSEVEIDRLMNILDKYLVELDRLVPGDKS